jgi:DNA-binding CsgD family transcriptional regulator
VVPADKDYARAQRALERVLDHPFGDPDEVLQAFLEVSAGLLDVTSACWHRTDPVTGSPVSFGAIAEPPGSFLESMEYEFRRPDFNRFADLRAQRAPARAISTVTGARVNESARFREMIAPALAADELRVAFCDPFGMWAAMVLFTGRRMTEADERFAGAAVGPVSAALRSATMRGSARVVRAGEDSDVMAVLILDGEDRVVAADASARARLAKLPGADPGHVPGLISFLAAQARWDAAGPPPGATMRTEDGSWLLVNASPMDSGSQVAVVMRPAPAGQILDRQLRLLGLSAREREVAARAAQGHSAKSIAAALVISPWTVQDHLKAIYAKAGVASREDLNALASGGVPTPVASSR